MRISHTAKYLRFVRTHFKGILDIKRSDWGFRIGLRPITSLDSATKLVNDSREIYFDLQDTFSNILRKKMIRECMCRLIYYLTITESLTSLSRTIEIAQDTNMILPPFRHGSISFPCATSLSISFDPTCETERERDELQLYKESTFKNEYRISYFSELERRMKAAVFSGSFTTRGAWSDFKYPFDHLYYCFRSYDRSKLKGVIMYVNPEYPTVRSSSAFLSLLVSDKAILDLSLLSLHEPRVKFSAGLHIASLFGNPNYMEIVVKKYGKPFLLNALDLVGDDVIIACFNNILHVLNAKDAGVHVLKNLLSGEFLSKLISYSSSHCSEIAFLLFDILHKLLASDDKQAEAILIKCLGMKSDIVVQAALKAIYEDIIVLQDSARKYILSHGGLSAIKRLLESTNTQTRCLAFTSMSALLESEISTNAFLNKEDEEETHDLIIRLLTSKIENLDPFEVARQIISILDILTRKHSGEQFRALKNVNFSSILYGSTLVNEHLSPQWIELLNEQPAAGNDRASGEGRRRRRIGVSGISAKGGSSSMSFGGDSVMGSPLRRGASVSGSINASVNPTSAPSEVGGTGASMISGNSKISNRSHATAAVSKSFSMSFWLYPTGPVTNDGLPIYYRGSFSGLLECNQSRETIRSECLVKGGKVYYEVTFNSSGGDTMVRYK